MAAAAPPGGVCEVCRTETRKHCALCTSTFYCCRDHQRAHWGIHKKTCPGKRSTAADTKSRTDTGKKIKPPPDSWAVGLSGKFRYEWFVDCYRLRLDDDYLNDSYLHGFYAENSSASSIVLDFLVFCKLAVKQDVIPSYPVWSWEELARVATDMLKFAFEKSDAREKYGGENVFSVLFAGMYGGRSLRHTSSLVYGVLHGGENHEATLIIQEMEITAKSEVMRSGATDRDEKYDGIFFNDVGGSSMWHNLIEKLN